MDNFSPLYDLIQALQYGNRFHISIEFFNRAIRSRLQLPFRHIIHGTAFCDAVKLRPNGLNRCMRCKRLATEKARKTQKPFGGYCVNGAYEYCHPVYKDNSLLCIIFVGNILRDRELFLRKSKLSPQDPIIDTMEPDTPDAVCQKIAQVLASYICMLLNAMDEPTKEKPINPTIAAVRSYLDCYFYHDITLSGLAQLYHYNEKYLGSLFKKQLGISFHDYLNQRRLYHAKTLLTHSRDSILDIAARSGFNNVTYFNRIFRANYGMTPSQFRKNSANTRK
ncbi:MAG: helix-turn-helix domain-containing protein [Ruminococcaceae bacterium]|nr:helix-turn-helix domain-containing protein [Oscillospiraceae bacterium]